MFALSSTYVHHSVKVIIHMHIRFTCIYLYIYIQIQMYRILCWSNRTIVSFTGYTNPNFTANCIRIIRKIESNQNADHLQCMQASINFHVTYAYLNYYLLTIYCLMAMPLPPSSPTTTNDFLKRNSIWVASSRRVPMVNLLPMDISTTTTKCRCALCGIWSLDKTMSTYIEVNIENTFGFTISCLTSRENQLEQLLTSLSCSHELIQWLNIDDALALQTIKVHAASTMCILNLKQEPYRIV